MIEPLKKQNNNPTLTNPNSTLYNSTNEKFRAINTENEIKIFNKTFSEGFKQSPKITSGKVRNIYIQTPKLFSARDIDDKKTISRGTSFQGQYKRLNDDEIQKLFGITCTHGWNYDKNFMKKIRENTEKLKDKFRNIKMTKMNNFGLDNGNKFNNINNTDPNNIYSKKNSKQGNDININNNKPEIIKIRKIYKNEKENQKENEKENEYIKKENENIENLKENENIENLKENIENLKENEKEKEIKNPENEKIKKQQSTRSKSSHPNLTPIKIESSNFIKTPHSRNNKKENEIKIEFLKTTPSLPSFPNYPKLKPEKKNNSFIEMKNRNDKWIPKGYKEYEYIVNNPRLIQKQISTNNPFAGRLPDLSLKDIRDKSRQSDIFFRKPPSIIEDEFNQKTLFYKDHQNSDIFLEKNDMDSILKNGETYLFKPNKIESYTNSRESNSKWMAKTNIPTLLNHVSTEYNIINPGNKGISNTKNKILIDCENKKNPNFECVNNFNPIYRQKSLCEFIDITRNGAPNPGKDYLKAYNSSKDAFRLRSEVCGTLGDLHHTYKELIVKPFSMNKFG